MNRTAKKVTVNLPTDVLERAQKITGRGITPTIIEGLRELERRAQRSALRQLRQSPLRARSRPDASMILTSTRDADFGQMLCLGIPLQLA